jgi:hypothetical protein
MIRTRRSIATYQSARHFEPSRSWVRNLSSLIIGLLLAYLLPLPASAQVQIGTPPFGSFSGGPEIINNANLNVHWTIPIRHKPGRGTNFDYDLTYDSSVWTQASVNGTTTWQPTSKTAAPSGWNGLTPAGNANLSFSVTYYQGTCWNNGPVTYQQWSYGNFTYYDSSGFYNAGISGNYFQSPPGSCPPSGPLPAPPWTGSAGNGSTLYVTPYGSGSVSAYIIDKNGTTTYPPINYNPSSSVWSIDRNGNEITTSNGTYTDTLNTNVLNVIGTAPSNTGLSYTAPSGANASNVVSYKTYTVRTNFGCGSVTDYNTNGTIQSSLVDRVTLPDGSYYQFLYETTPLDTHSPHHVTGRVASVQLPTGGTITYAYTGGPNLAGYGNTGITCSDGSAAGLTRTTPDGPWIYTRSTSSPATTITAPKLPYDTAANDTVIQFSGIYETQAKPTRAPRPLVAHFSRLSRPLIRTTPHPSSSSGTLALNSAPQASRTCISTSMTARPI